MPYEFLEDVAVSDIAFRAWGETIEDIFQASADAVMNVMIEDLDSIQPIERRILRLEDDDLDMLLFNFLQELIYYKDSAGLFLRVPEIAVRKEDGFYRLRAALAGEKIDLSRHRTRVDVKAVTLHDFFFGRKNSGWEARVILDI